MVDTTSAKIRLTPKTVKNLRSISTHSPCVQNASGPERPYLGTSASQTPNVIAGAYGMVRAAPACASELTHLRIAPYPITAAASNPPTPAVHNAASTSREAPNNAPKP